MIELSNVTKIYARTPAVQSLSFHVKKGEVLGFLGRNGAGKTTTMNIMTGYISKTGGDVIVDGFDLSKNPSEVKKRIGYLPENPPLYPDMTVTEYLTFVCSLRNIRKPGVRHEIERVMKIVHVEDVKGRPIRNLSKGYRQRVGIAQALISSPEYVLLDEPTIGLDPVQIVEIRSLIQSLKNHSTVILSSHILGEIAQVCDRVVIIHKGKLMAQNSIEELLKAARDKSRLILRIKSNKKAIEKVLTGTEMTFVCLGEQESGTLDYMVEAHEKIDLREILFSRISAAKLVLLEMRSQTFSLEDVFLQIIDEQRDCEGADQ